MWKTLSLSSTNSEKLLNISTKLWWNKLKQSKTQLRNLSCTLRTNLDWWPSPRMMAPLTKKNIIWRFVFLVPSSTQPKWRYALYNVEFFRKNSKVASNGLRKLSLPPHKDPEAIQDHPRRRKLPFGRRQALQDYHLISQILFTLVNKTNQNIQSFFWSPIVIWNNKQWSRRVFLSPN